MLAAITVAVVALAPFALRYATETRMYSLVMCLVFAGYLLIDDVVRRGRHGILRLAGITLVTAALLYSALLGAVAGRRGLPGAGVARVRDGNEDVRQGARRVLVALVIGGVLFVPWLPAMLYQSAHTGTPWAGPQRPTSILAVTLGDFGGGGFRDADFIGTVLAMVFALGLFGQGVARDRIELQLRTARQFRYEALVMALTLGLGTAAAYAAAAAYASRYAAVFFPLFILIVAGGISRFVGRWLRFAVLCVVLALSLMGAYHGATAPRSQARQIAASVAEHAEPGDLVVYCPDQLGPAGRTGDARRSSTRSSSPTSRHPSGSIGSTTTNASKRPMPPPSPPPPRRGPARVGACSSCGTVSIEECKASAKLSSTGSLRPGVGDRCSVPDGGGDYFEHAQLVWFPAQT